MKLDKLRKQKEKQEQSRSENTCKADKNDDNVVVLTRTDRAGNVVPVNASRSTTEKKGKRRKRHKMVSRALSFAAIRYSLNLVW